MWGGVGGGGGVGAEGQNGQEADGGCNHAFSRTDAGGSRDGHRGEPAASGGRAGERKRSRFVFPFAPLAWQHMQSSPDLPSAGALEFAVSTKELAGGWREGVVGGGERGVASSARVHCGIEMPKQPQQAALQVQWQQARRGGREGGRERGEREGGERGKGERERGEGVAEGERELPTALAGPAPGARAQSPLLGRERERERQIQPLLGTPSREPAARGASQQLELVAEFSRDHMDID